MELIKNMSKPLKVSLTFREILREYLLLKLSFGFCSIHIKIKKKTLVFITGLDHEDEILETYLNGKYMT